MWWPFNLNHFLTDKNSDSYLTEYLYEFEKIASYNFYLYLFYAQTNKGIDLKKPIIIYKGYHPGETTVIKVKIKDN